MKRILGLSLVAAFLTFGIGANVASASTINSTALQANHQVTYASTAAQRWGRPRTRFVTRTVRQGRHLYRITYRITTNRFGRTSTSIVNRIRLR
jgi:hypothetical protein